MKSWLSTYSFRKRAYIGRLLVEVSMRRADGFMGRFGGGWNWKFGFQIGGRTIIFSLLVADLRLSLLKEKPQQEDEVEQARRHV
jgi:hypothetical protein